ncbi:large ribosomal subunit protein eL18x-like [Musa acuminata AAA Group]|uniref:large ribosomal subunit protein eL18x-like n=1 Tax=Musa acuminata AAA Group TaxID=214697 RepID=UPI0031D45C26
MVSPNPAPSYALRGTLISPRLFFVGSFDSRLVDLVRARGIDLGAGGRSKKARRTAPRFDDVYLKLLVSSVEDGSKFTTAIRERLFTSKINQPDDKITVIVVTVMDAKRHYEVLSLAVTAPRVMGTSEARILKVG